jgi:hypothetical protein
MSAKEIKALVRRNFEAWNKGKAAFMTVIDETYITDVIYHTAAGRDVRGFLTNMRLWMILSSRETKR